MKKLTTAVFVTGALASIIAFSAPMSVAYAVETFSPIAKSVIAALESRIAVLTAENESLRAKVATCAPQNLGGVVTPPALVMAPAEQEQTVSVSVTYRTDAPFVAKGKTQDRCPTFTFTSDKPFFIEKFVFTPQTASTLMAHLDGDMPLQGDKYVRTRKDRASTVKTVRACFGDVYTQPTTTLILDGAGTLLYTQGGTRIQIGDVRFTY